MTTLKARRKLKAAQSRARTFGDVLDKLGGVGPDRVVFIDPPGTATVRDLIEVHAATGRRYELVDGFVVENPMGGVESFLAMELGFFIRDYLRTNNIGFIFGESGVVRIMPKLARAPDVAFFSWSKRPDRTIPDEAVPRLVPDIAVEILSRSNSSAEMERKLQEYFAAGVLLVWIINPKSRSASVYTSPTEFTRLTSVDALDGGDVLPGFLLPLATLFAQLGPAPKAKPKRRKK